MAIMATNLNTTVINTKSFYTSKTFWAGLFSIFTGISIIVQTGHVDMNSISAIIAGIGAIIGRAQATGPIGLSTYSTTTTTDLDTGSSNSVVTSGVSNETSKPPFNPFTSK
jgi:hypothetical protein